ncbi:hypothetical protein [Candidatus Poriferisodalis sp.]|uniref:hypothetical protein n=1 Tax=Candidatus Poriferisodalis sp. TaxID=3101277 RepID=UPI003B51C158
MALEEALAKARATLESGDLHSEAAVRLAVIVPVLTALGWDPADPKQWVPEMPVPSGRVDDALKSDTGTPLVFVEAKRHGNLSAKAEEQLFDYAAKQGVPMLVLTDGDTWDLYLAMAAGEPHERRFAHVELTQSSDMATIAEDLTRFLQRDAVVNQQANFAAQQRLAEVNDRLKGKRGLASGWLSLLQEGDDLLRELLIDRVEERTGSRPWADDVDAFLAGLANRLGASAASPMQYEEAATWLQSAPTNLTPEIKAAVTKWRKQLSDSSSEPVSKPAKKHKTTSVQGSLRGFRIRGVVHSAQDGWETLTTLAAVLEQHKPGFLQELALHGNAARKWPRAVRHDDPVIQTKTEGPSYRPVKGHPDWLLLVHGSTKSKLGWMRQMTDMAGLAWESDIEPIFAGSSS